MLEAVNTVPNCHYHRRVNPTCRSGRVRSDPHRISSEPDIFHKKPIGSDKNSVGSDRNFFDPTGSDSPSVTWVVKSYNTDLSRSIPVVLFSEEN
jgi:hypothetical protein